MSTRSRVAASAVHVTEVAATFTSEPWIQNTSVSAAVVVTVGAATAVPLVFVMSTADASIVAAVATAQVTAHCVEAADANDNVAPRSPDTSVFV
jgi:hypothetical protein